MPAPVEDDARGIIDVAAGLAKFRLERFAPSPPVARFVDRYWVVTWDLPTGVRHTQRTLDHPVAHIVLYDGAATVYGPMSRIDSRDLEGLGRVVGIMFRPAGFRPFLGEPMATITDAAFPAAELFGPSMLDELAHLLHDDEIDPVVAAKEADDFLAEVVPDERQPCEDTTTIVERVAADPAAVRVDELAASCGLSPRQLQRRFADHVGLSPKAVIRRYRLYEAAERARLEEDVDWATVAAELRYSDQAHLVRDFSATFGAPPDRYARRQRRVRPSSS